ncbi:MAG: MFS transporter [Candidatus Humimicrobiia bacterium]
MKNDLNKIKNNNKNQNLKSNINVLSSYHFLGGIYFNMLLAIRQPFFLSLNPSMTFVGLLEGIGGFNGIMNPISQLTGGWLSDRKGRKRFVVIASLFVISAMIFFLIAGYTKLAFFLIPAMLFFGASAISWPSFDSIIAESVSEEKMAISYSIFMFAGVFPGIFAPFLGGKIADLFGYLPVFSLGIFIEILCLILIVLYLKETLFVKNKERSNFSQFLILLKDSFKIPKILRNFYIATIVDIFVWGLGSSILFGMLRKTFNFSVSQIGILTCMISISWAITQIPVGRLIEKFGCKIFLILSELIGVITMFGFLISTKYEHFLIFAFSWGMVASTWVPAMKTLVANSVDKTKRAEAIGKLSFFRGLFGFPAPFIGGILFDNFGFKIPILANLIGAFIAAILIYFLIHESPKGNLAYKTQ